MESHRRGPAVDRAKVMGKDPAWLCLKAQGSGALGPSLSLLAELPECQTPPGPSDPRCHALIYSPEKGHSGVGFQRGSPCPHHGPPPTLVPLSAVPRCIQATSGGAGAGTRGRLGAAQA